MVRCLVRRHNRACVFAVPYPWKGSRMQEAVEELVALGQLPVSARLDLATIEIIQKALARVKSPVTDEEARALVPLLGPDNCFGLAWTLLHLIETAPNWPLPECLRGSDNDWINLLKERAKRREAHPARGQGR
jgi:hypothetical protein